MKIDYREHKILKDFPEAEVCNLEVGDIVDGELCIERKTGEDFLASLRDRRIFNQALNMRQNYKYPIIIVENDLVGICKLLTFGKNIGVSMEQVRGATASLYVKYKIPVLFCSTHHHFKDIIQRLITKSKEDCDGKVFTPAINKTTADPKLQVLLQIPGIGETKAKKILDHYGQFSNIGFMERPPGVSEKDIEQIKEVLK